MILDVLVDLRDPVRVRSPFREQLMSSFRRFGSLCAVFAALTSTWTLAVVSRADEAPAKPQAAGNSSFSKVQIDFFEKQVEPILKARCLTCHGGEEKIKGGLRLVSRSAVLKGGDQGSA